MDSINFQQNIHKINDKSLGIRNVQMDEKHIEQKNAQASSLDALSSYAKATVSFAGTSSDYEKRLESFKQRLDEQLKQNPKLLEGRSFPYSAINKYNLEFAEKCCFEDNRFNEFNFKYLPNILIGIDTQEKVELAEILCFSKADDGLYLFPHLEFVEMLLDHTPCYFTGRIIDFIKRISSSTDKEGTRLFTNKNRMFERTISQVTEENITLAERLCFGVDENGDDLFPQKRLISFILTQTNDDTIDLAEKLCLGIDENGKELFPNKNIISNILSSIDSGTFVIATDEDIQLRLNFAEKLSFGKDESGNQLFTPKEAIKDVVSLVNTETIELAELLCFGKDEQGNKVCPDVELISKILKCSTDADIDEVKNLLLLLKDDEITSEAMLAVLDKANEISIKDFKKLKSFIGNDATKKLSKSDFYLACKMVDLANKKDINEIDLAKKKSIIRNLVNLNDKLYSASAELKNIFPLVPSNKDEYCSLLQSLCKSIGIETNELSPVQVEQFNSDVVGLSSSLATLSDKEFNSLGFVQEYPKEDFIKNTFAIVKDLSDSERQKVYDYFGFELKHNKNGTQVDRKSWHSFSIIGYPVNLNNGKKLAKIESLRTRAVVERLRSEVIKFSQNNFVSCSNKQIETYINELLSLCPELRTQIGRIQHGTHEFDVFKHSLKVMQKIAQNPEFNDLDESDKKVILLASLFHDINKSEGRKDPTHANESAFDAFYITKKFALTKEETNKLYSLIKHHEWLGYTNSSRIKDENERDERIKSVAYDLHYDNLFELSKIFTEADLKAVQSSNGFYNRVQNVFETNSSKVADLVKELKASQPLLPVTKIPTASRIKEAITTVNTDGTTNLKGIYQDKNGMVIIRFNEVENETWEKIGFPSGSISNGIKADAYVKIDGKVHHSVVNTGNIKFFAHGLIGSEKLRNFDAFALPDSDALLSVSYMERPESKYRLFRTQGALLDVDTKYVHGGGNTDRGSGCKKFLDEFKQEYAFSTGLRHSDRIYVSDLIKKSLGLADDEYIDFVNKNVNKPISEIEPAEYRMPLIRAFATINSNERNGERAYNEMYVTNPRVMGVFAYSFDDNVGETMDFVEKQENFLKQYAINEDLPFIVFGD